jgi:glutaredoxin 3
MSLKDYSDTYIPKYHDLVAITKEHEEAHWTEDEAKLQDDVEQWKTGFLSDSEMNLIRNILRLFTTSDVNVGQGYYDKLIPMIKNNEARNMLGSFASREGTHQRGYALLNDTLGFGDDFYNEFLDFAEMKEKHEFQIESIGKSLSDFAGYLAKQTLIEGVSLFASFAMLLNFDRQGKMKGMSEVVLWSIRDESIHVKGNSLLFRIFLDEHPRIVNDEFKRGVYDCARELVRLEDAFIDRAFEMGDMNNLASEDVKGYIRYVTDYRLTQLGFKPIWDLQEHPLPWVDALVSGTSHGNFFEREIVDYSKNNLTGDFDEYYTEVLKNT